MPKTLESFKRAFSKRVSSDADNCRARQEKTQAALNRLLASVERLEPLRPELDQAGVARIDAYRAEHGHMQRQLDAAVRASRDDPRAAYKAMEGLKRRARELADESARQADVMSRLVGDRFGVETLKKTLKSKDGTRRLDDTISRLGDGMRREVVQTAIELRFGVTVELQDDPNLSEEERRSEGTKALRRIYEVMSKVPDSHTRDNKSLKAVKRTAGPEGTSLYRRSEKKMVLQCGRPGGDLAPIGNPAQIPDVEERCLPRDDVPTPRVFDWTTLHEVGHAVDAKKKFMNNNAKGDSYGAWRTHSVADVAKIAAKHFGYDRAYIEAMLRREPPTDTPARPRDVTQKAWDDAQIEAMKWCAFVGEPMAPWNDGPRSADLAIDGRVYHECYENEWQSYSLAARKRAISGYQFRAAGEWFAELYAAWHSGVLRENHPAAKWLKDL